MVFFKFKRNFLFSGFKKIFNLFMYWPDQDKK